MKIDIVDHSGHYLLSKKLDQSICLMDFLNDNQLYMPFDCQGNGTCGKCKVRFLEGGSDLLRYEENKLTEEELSQGIRLACQTVIEDDCKIMLLKTEENFFIPVDQAYIRKEKHNLNTDKKYGIAIDLGTTTISMLLCDIDHQEVYGSYVSLNHQRQFGADIMSRIQAAISGKAEQLKKVILNDLEIGIRKLLAECSNPIDVAHIAIAGNTTMIHLLRGYDCQCLAQYPFITEKLDLEELDIDTLFEKKMNIPGHIKVTIFPGISAFLGGDLMACIYAEDYHLKEHFQMLIDLGTNAEIVAGCKGKLYATSAAAGPAFEGGAIEAGTGSIPGAIWNASIQYNMIRYQTIGKVAASGICGTGLLSIIAELKRNHWIDQNGTIIRKATNQRINIIPNKIVLTQNDIREFQKAKAAICVAMESLIAESGYKTQDIHSLDIAGSFGKYLKIEDAWMTGMFPQIDETVVETKGNLVLAGLHKYLRLENHETLCDIKKNIKVINLAERQNMADELVKRMKL